MHKSTADAVLDRLLLVFEAKNDTELAGALDTNRQTLGSWRSRGSIPYALCIEIAERKELSLDWLLTGRPPMYRGQAHITEAALSNRQQALLGLFESLSEDRQREILIALEDKKRVSTLEAELQELKTVIERLTGAA